MQRLLSIPAMTLFGFLAISGEAATFNFRVSGVPIPATGTCDDFAHDEGQRLESYVGPALVEVTDARCFPVDSQSWNFDISYKAAEQLQLVSTYDSESVLDPGYKTKDACDKAMASEKATFETQTGIKPFQAYCRVPRFSSLRWMIAVQGFGKPDATPFSSWTEVYGSPIGYTLETFTSLVKTRLLNYQSHLTLLTMTSGPASQRLSIRYYGPSRIRLEETKVANYSSADLCQAAVAEVEKGFDDSNAVSLGTYCHQLAMSSIFELVSLTNQGSGVYVGSTQARYDTLALCEAGKPSVLAHYRSDLNRDVKAGVCSLIRGSNAFEIILIEKMN